ncbi:hypothetical protein NLJ89_g11204 [Agrocybe chaxingu]|uniref:GDP/GTP exchange factor Sec2 N-terminal domain-containing protein n=1 Tax=Agrocybe chaxingu TaxID=84603 RepID=A0A9W8JQD2_9AGAR|nr:hypothetical protein NLJ89_g11204 [Agrocybe chaxingu]
MTYLHPLQPVFRFSTSGLPTSRPGTPNGSGTGPAVQAHHLTSPSMPSLSSVRTKELEDLTAELEKEKAARKKIAEEKAALEAELESLSQALFEEANNMVATERKMRAESEEELRELRQEKEALRSALRVIEGENTHLRESALSSPQPEHTIPNTISRADFSNSRPASRSSSRIGIKSRPQSLDLPSTLPLPPSPAPSHQGYDDDAPLSTSNTSTNLESEKTPSKVLADNLLSPTVLSPEEESQPTPRFHTVLPPRPSEIDDPFLGPSPWADVPSKSASPEPSNALHVTTAFSAIR